MLKKIIFLFFAALLIVSCASDQSSQHKQSPYVSLQGETMGTYYRVTYSDAEERNFQSEIDELLRIINLEVSTYIDHSTISTFNKSDGSLQMSYNPESQQIDNYPNTHFLANFKAAQKIYLKTDGYFDPTVMPLVNYWGFGYTEKKKVQNVDSIQVDSLLQLIGMDKIQLSGSGDDVQLIKNQSQLQLDFSAIAKGYAVDAIARMLSQGKKVEHYLVDIGGEVVAKGKNSKGKFWTIGINLPKEGAAVDAIQTAVPLKNRALATSGNYRNFYEVDGIKYSHTISPKTGFPERNTLLSASVFATDCMTADAYATAFMVMGLDKAFDLASQTEELEAYFIYSTDKGEMAVKYTTDPNSLFNEPEE